MPRFIEGQDRHQVTLMPECLDDFIAEDNTVRIVDVFIGELDLVALGFDGASPAATGRPSYHPSVMLKLYLYGYPHDEVAVCEGWWTHPYGNVEPFSNHIDFAICFLHVQLHPRVAMLSQSSFPLTRGAAITREM